VIIKHRTFGRAVPRTAHVGEHAWLPCAKVLGAAAGAGTRSARLGRQHLRDELRLAVGNAVDALNRGAALAGCLQNTGEGGISPYHRTAAT
jgi:hypothetical protein